MQKFLAGNFCKKSRYSNRAINFANRKKIFHTKNVLHKFFNQNKASYGSYYVCMYMHIY